MREDGYKYDGNKVYRLKSCRGKETQSPVVVLWNYTKWCNFNCLHCYSRKENGKDIVSSDYDNIARQLIEAKVLHVNFGGGESLGKEDFFRTARLLWKAGITVSLSTNGWLVTEKVAKNLAEIGIDAVTVSLNGSTAERHDIFCKKAGAFKRALRAIEILQSYGIKTRVATTVSIYTMDDIEQISSIVFADELVFQSLNSPKRSPLTIPPKKWRGLYLRFVKIQQNSKIPVSLDFLNDKETAAILGKKTDCPCGKWLCTIKPNGDLVPCVFVNVPVGSLLKNHLLELWGGKILKEIREKNLNPCCL